jgi:hypothetical protein
MRACMCACACRQDAGGSRTGCARVSRHRPTGGLLHAQGRGCVEQVVSDGFFAQCAHLVGEQMKFFACKSHTYKHTSHCRVGEAERQLRLLFEEASRCAPAIIFFDEIDGLAPVRSAKQVQLLCCRRTRYWSTRSTTQHLCRLVGHVITLIVSSSSLHTLPAQASRWATTANTTHAALEHK